MEYASGDDDMLVHKMMKKEGKLAEPFQKKSKSKSKKRSKKSKSRRR